MNHMDTEREVWIITTILFLAAFIFLSGCSIGPRPRPECQVKPTEAVGATLSIGGFAVAVLTAGRQQIAVPAIIVALAGLPILWWAVNSADEPGFCRTNLWINR